MYKSQRDKNIEKAFKEKLKRSDISGQSAKIGGLFHDAIQFVCNDSEHQYLSPEDKIVRISWYLTKLEKLHEIEMEKYVKEIIEKIEATYPDELKQQQELGKDTDYANDPRNWSTEKMRD